MGFSFSPSSYLSTLAPSSPRELAFMPVKDRIYQGTNILMFGAALLGAYAHFKQPRSIAAYIGYAGLAYTLANNVMELAKIIVGSSTVRAYSNPSLAKYDAQLWNCVAREPQEGERKGHILSYKLKPHLRQAFFRSRIKSELLFAEASRYIFPAVEPTETLIIHRFYHDEERSVRERLPSKPTEADHERAKDGSPQQVMLGQKYSH